MGFCSVADDGALERSGEVRSSLELSIVLLLLVEEREGLMVWWKRE
jgi:hypothetical protein